MHFLKTTISNNENGERIEYRAVVESEGHEDGFAYWCQQDQNREFANDHAVTIDDHRFIVGYLDHEAHDGWTRISAHEIPSRALAAIMFAMSKDFDTDLLEATII